MTTELVQAPTLPEEDIDKYDKIVLNLLKFLQDSDSVDGWSASELIRLVKHIRNVSELVLAVYLLKQHLPTDVYPYAFVPEDKFSFRLRLEKCPKFKELPDLDKLKKDRYASFERDHKRRNELALLGNAMFFLESNGVQGSFQFLGNLCASNEALSMYQYKAIWDVKLASQFALMKKANEEGGELRDVNGVLLTTPALQQATTKDGIMLLRAQLAIKPTLDDATRERALRNLYADVDKIESPRESGGTKIQINVMGSSDPINVKGSVSHGD